ncbi:E3 ubiquitin-protein ligase ubr2 [Cichlidogyrus casuarinus]|uniref:E3 ubiquitin-protein ligase ubr2 n=1 Tax=Cichlidogyrus casuarinus TaxID=1844966 RepID=A0ABD2QMV9_9PLAT
MRTWWNNKIYREKPHTKGEKQSSLRCLMHAEEMSHTPSVGQNWCIAPYGYPTKVYQLDSQRPPALITPRNGTLSEVGLFLTLCPHSMHTKCKLQHGQHIKRTFDEWTRRRNTYIAFEYRCALCKAMSEIDLPIYQALHRAEVPRLWMEQQFSQELVSLSPNSALSNWYIGMCQWVEDHHCRNPDEINELYFSWRLTNALRLECGLPVDVNDFYNVSDEVKKMNKSERMEFELTQLEKISKTCIECLEKTMYQMSEKNVDTASVGTSTKSRGLLSGLRRKSLRLTMKDKNSPVGSEEAETPAGEPVLKRVAVSFPNPDLKPPHVSESLYSMVQRINSLSTPRRISSLVSRNSDSHRMLQRELLVNLQENLQFFDPEGSDDESSGMAEIDDIALALLPASLPRPSRRTARLQPEETPQEQPPDTPLDPTTSERKPVQAISERPPSLFDSLDELHYGLYSLEMRLRQFLKVWSPSLYNTQCGT